MIPEREDRIRELFVQAIDLDTTARAQLLDRECGDDTELREEVLSLLDFHAPETIITNRATELDQAQTTPDRTNHPPPTFADAFRASLRELSVRCVRSRAGRLTILGIAILLLSGVGTWMYYGTRDALRHILAVKLQTLLSADVAAMEIWMNDRKALAGILAKQEGIRTTAEQLVDLGSGETVTREELLTSPQLKRLRDDLGAFIRRDGSAGFALIDRSGRVLASNDDYDIGVQLRSKGMEALAAVFDDKITITKPFPQGAFAPNQPFQPDAPVVWANAPVHDAAGNVIAALGFGWRADSGFSQVLSVARMGKTGETYAFDRNGEMLSESRFDPELRRIGLIPDTQDSRSIFHVQVRDPGGNLMNGYRPTTNLKDRSLTEAAEAAVASSNLQSTALQSGVILQPYRDYRGVDVIGAWRWLPQYDFGVVTEVDSDEAYALLRYPIIAFWIRFAVLSVAICALLGASVRIALLKQKIGMYQRLDEYSLLRKIGEGGMGEVYLARHALLRRPAAVKLLRADRNNRHDVRRFQREVQLASQLTHPNTIEIYDYGRTDDNVFYYAMEYLPGISLAELVQLTGPVPIPRVVHVLRQICGSLREAHGVGLVHRDIKPQNVMLCDRGGEADFVKVLDFGLVKDTTAVNTSETSMPSVIVGTPLYMAPERLQSPDDIDARADIYAIGAVAYYLVAGRHMFDATSQMDVVFHVINVTPDPPSEHSPHDVPPELDQLIMDCLAKDPAARPSSAQEVLDRLGAMTSVAPWTQQQAHQWWGDHRDQLRRATAIASLLETLPAAANTLAFSPATSTAKHQ